MSTEAPRRSRASRHSQAGSLGLLLPVTPARMALRENGRSRPLLLFFLALTLTLFLPIPWVVLGYVTMPAYYAVRWRALGSPIPAIRVNLFILVLLVGSALGLLVTPRPLAGAVSAGNLLAAVTCFYILTDFIQSPADVWLVAVGLVTLGLGITLLIPFRVEWSLNKVYPLPGQELLEPPTSGVNPNLIAGQLAVILPLAISLLFARRWRKLGVGAVVSLGLSLIVLQSRGALFGVAGSLALVATAVRRWLLPLLMLLALGGVTTNSYLGGESLAPYILGRAGTATSGTTAERLAMWGQAFELIRANPLTGIGMAAYPAVAPYAPPYSTAAPGPVEPHAHNLFLQVALSAGVPGLAGFIPLLVWAMVSAWRAYARGIVPPLALGVLAALGIVTVHGQVDSIFWGNKSNVLLWVIFAISLSLARLGQSDVLPHRGTGLDEYAPDDVK